MATYRVLIEGRNFILNVDGKSARYGFYQVMFLEATDEQEAETEAVRLLKSDVDLKTRTENHTDDPPKLFVESITAVDRNDTPGVSSVGRSYFRDKPWWRFW